MASDARILYSLIIMLLALGLVVYREFRAQTRQYRRRWDVVFSIGSVVATLMQGLIVGGLASRSHDKGDTFGGSVFDCWPPSRSSAQFCVLAGYIVLRHMLALPEDYRRVPPNFAERTSIGLTWVFSAFSPWRASRLASMQQECGPPGRIHTISLAAIGGLMALRNYSFFLQHRRTVRPFDR